MKIDTTTLSNLKEIERKEYLSTTSFRWFGLRMQQVPEALNKINHLLNYIGFDRVIEIGAGDGGLSCLLATHCEINGIPFHSFDIHDKGVNIAHLRKITNGFEVRDVIFNEENVKYIADLMQKPGKLLCIMDAGKKIEFNRLAQYLKVGDWVMLHDFAKDEKHFEENIKGKIWNWLECTYADIEEEAIKNNIVFSDYANDCVWAIGCKGPNK